jgi:aspartate kinase
MTGFTKTLVMKFGGTSVEDRDAFGRVAGIVSAHRRARPVVVVSAMARMTDALLSCAAAAANGGGGGARQLDEHFNRHLSVAEHLGAGIRDELTAAVERARLDVTRLLDEIAAEGAVAPRLQALIASYGEQLSARLLAAVISESGPQACYVDACRCIVTDSRHDAAAALMAETIRNTRAELGPIVEAGNIPVLGGFIAANRHGETTLLGRGGSDYTAALIGASLRSREIQIWTDVNGIQTADPRVVKTSRTVSRLSYSEAAELTYFGAKVLHPKTVRPAAERGIPLSVRNSRAPEHPGTLVCGDAEITSARPVKAIAHRTGGVTIDVISQRSPGASGLLRDVFEIFDRHGVGIDLITTSETGTSLAFNNNGALQALILELRRVCSLEVKENRAFVCLVGEGLRHTPGVAAEVSGMLRDVEISPVMPRASLNNLAFVVGEERIGEVVTRLHHAFFESERGNGFRP